MLVRLLETDELRAGGVLQAAAAAAPLVVPLDLVGVVGAGAEADAGEKLA